MKSNANGAQRRMFCCAPFVLFLRRVWAGVANIQCCQFQFPIFNSKPAIRNSYSNSQLELFPLATFNRSTAPHASKRRRMEALRLDDHARSGADEFVELFGVPVGEAEAAVRFCASYAFGKRGAMYSVAGD